ncbi:hypothetical protein NIES593_07220 [Hydrococcus rivularis NIES-593]|uniref:Uncharacterized protein n=1 Tax=Hydrococcus rivularis NIES-593 TaxID=1921803 RepID=A0A1U7HLI1_9CYAN|nr:hypothetical protein [Hydrococcus rivularis]OKH24460.1 hypothetical protein NIES593_07220 [Hydrococcus rivularis NIES-593]
MFISYIFLSFICLVSAWIFFNDRDPIHSLAAIFTGLLTLVWLFILTPLLLKLPLVIASVFVFHSIEIASKN